MNPTLRNIIAFIVGWISGSTVNMALISIGHILLPMEGINPNDMEALAAFLPNAEAKYFLFPFLAHAIGTLFGAMVTVFIAINHQMKLAFGIGALFLIGGIAVNIMLPGPRWFAAVDILFAYIPMAWIGAKISGKLYKPNPKH